MGTDAVEGTGKTLIERLKGFSLVQKTDRMLEKVPGLYKYLQKQADKVWEEGIEAIRAGDLYLKVYAQKEVMGAIEIFASLIGFDSAEEMIAADTRSVDIPPEATKTYLEQVECHIARLFTPARLDKLRSRMDAILRDPEYRGKWTPFVMMLSEYLRDEQAVENEIGFLISALFGEIGVLERVAVESAE